MLRWERRVTPRLLKWEARELWLALVLQPTPFFFYSFLNFPAFFRAPRWTQSQALDSVVANVSPNNARRVSKSNEHAQSTSPTSCALANLGIGRH